jgi:Pentapeptide repeats (9 copies)
MPKKRPWDPCSEAGCDAAGSSRDGYCLAHLPGRDLDAALASFAQGVPIDCRGVVFSDELLSKLVGAVARTEDDRPLLQEADFTKARFAKNANLSRVAFGNDTHFDGARFEARPSFLGATFGDRVSFRNAELGSSPDFRGSVFGARASFIGAQFGDGARFDGARFADGPSFSDATFGNDATLVDASFGRRARCDSATFGDRASFRNASFGREASLRKMTFGAKASFEEASFAGEASFSASSFGKNANLCDTTFGAGISFRRTTFGPLAAFRRASFGDRAWFTNARLGAGAAFADATFSGRTRFNLAVFGERADFKGATFSGRVSFEQAVFDGRVSFRLANFERTRDLGPMVVLGLLLLDGVSFLERVQIEVSAHQLVATRLRMPDGGDLRVRWAEIVLDQASFGAPGVLAASSARHRANETELVRRFELRDPRPRLISARGANLSDLAVSGLDLSECRFVGAHNLERLRVEGDSFFARSPAGTSGRQVIAEEQEWRVRRGGRRWPRWEAPTFTFPTEDVEKPRVLAPHAIALIYRALRTAHETKGDAPGAADFYFGEMEMRRLDKTSPRAERATLWLYWLVSGYGLRSLRALAALLVTIVAFALLFRWFGFKPRIGYTRALLFSAESTSSLFRVPETSNTTLTQAGEALQIALRLLGPLFFGLALLSLRGRVRR